MRGFPVALPMPDGTKVWIDLAEPAFLASMDPDHIGTAVLDSVGYVLQRWGLAESIELFDGSKSLVDTELGALVVSALKGKPATKFLDGARYWASEISRGGVTDVLVLVTNASEEAVSQRTAWKSTRSADVLKRIGKALTMNQTLNPLCVFVVNEIVSANELAAALLWVRTLDGKTLELTASLGITRQGTSLLYMLDPAGGTSCIAEFVIGERKSWSVKSAQDNVMTAELEAKICYLTPGGVHVLPLVIGDRVIGVLELIGKEGDTHFSENGDLFETIAEHLALALNSAMMFENAERLASFDPLTGIANHRTMQEFLNRRVSECERSGQYIGLIMLDVDHFRSFNEEEGHDAGDEVLRLVAGVLKECVRTYDIAARYGGEEFTLVLPGMNLVATTAVAERIRQRISEISFLTRSGRARHVTASFGCSSFPDTAMTSQSLLKAADDAMFRAKRDGRNRVVAYEDMYCEDVNAAQFDLGASMAFLTKAQRAEAETRSKQFHGLLIQLASELGLSRSQEQMLDALVRVAPAYLALREKGTKRKLEKLEASNEFRSLMPSLLSIDERFDGMGPQKQDGPHIPLLGRVLAVLMAIEFEKGLPLTKDPGRFDPEIVSLVTKLDLAA